MGFVYGFVYGVCVRDGRGREKRKEKRRQLRTKSEQNGLTRNKPPKNKR